MSAKRPALAVMALAAIYATYAIARVIIDGRRPPALRALELAAPSSSATVAPGDDVAMMLTVLAPDESAEYMEHDEVPGLEVPGRYRQVAQFRLGLRLGDRVVRPLPNGKTFEFVVDTSDRFGLTAPPDGAATAALVMLRFRPSLAVSCRRGTFAWRASLPDGEAFMVAMDCVPHPVALAPDAGPAR